MQWINQDFIAHTATADDGSWNSELIDVKGNWQMNVSKETPEDYFCVFHPNMKGNIIVIK